MLCSVLVPCLWTLMVWNPPTHCILLDQFCIRLLGSVRAILSGGGHGAFWPAPFLGYLFGRYQTTFPSSFGRGHAGAVRRSLCAGKLDLFNNAHYGQLLRISFSGITWLLAQARRVEISARLNFDRVLAPDPFALVSILWEFPMLQPLNTHAYAAVYACLNALLLYYWPFFRLVVMSSWNSLPMP